MKNGVRITTMTTNKCKCECHVPTLHKYSEGKRISAELCSECLENHKRHKDYKGIKALVKVGRDIGF
jgi:hypothetical protein